MSLYYKQYLSTKMAVVIIMPKQGQSVESCIITEINKKEGESVIKGDILFSYETDKASFEEVSHVDGVVLECFYDEGDEVPVLENMMIIGKEGEDISSLITGSPGIQSNSKKEEYPKTHNNKNTQKIEILGSANPSHHIHIRKDTAAQLSSNIEHISPRAKNLAKREAIDLSNLKGSGPGGRIIERDIKTYTNDRAKMTPLAKRIAKENGMSPQEKGTGLAGAYRSVDLVSTQTTLFGNDYEDRTISNMRKIIARSMHSSLQNSAQLTHHLGADARRLLEIRKKVKFSYDKGQISVNVTLNDMVCFAVIKALKQYPEVNAHFIGEAKRYFKKIHLGLAVDTDRGLIVPVVRNADDLSITELSSQLKDIAAACRAGNINPDLLSSEAASFTVSNLGNYGVEMFTPVINLPQSAILGVNTIIPRPKDLGNGVYAFVPHIGLSLTYDHRSLDGGEATRFLKQIAVEIENLQLEITL